MSKENPTYKEIFNLSKSGGKFSEVHRDILREEFGKKMPDGQYRITVEQAKEKRYNATRYKYYFDCVLTLALPVVRGRYLIVDEYGDTKHPSNTEDLHECYKLEYNSVQVVIPHLKKSFSTANSTTNLSDRDFIAEYQEMIIESLISPPLCLDIPLIEEWRELRKAKKWKEFLVNQNQV